MGQTVDTRVVELKFDNSDFEKNVQTSLKSIDNINKSLDSMGSGKSLSGLEQASKSVSFDDASKSATLLQKRFSILGIAGMSAINNITNSVMNMGKNMLASLSGINAMKAGFHEYETQLNSVQTILANTKSKGSTLKDVNSALNELNHYADKTIYNFTEMTRNIGTFTAAGVGLNKSVSSIKGIANLAAVSGSNAQQASTAMYQLSQAIASGSVKLQDWNSVVNAGMGGEVFQNALKRTAKAQGKNVDAMIKKYGSFRESLSKGGWLTTKVLTDTLKQFSGDVSKKELIAQGYTKKQIKEIMDMAKTAEDAATKVKTFSQLMDTLAEAVQSGWTESWQYILGDFTEAKTMWTSVSDTLGAFIQKSADARNSMLKFWHDAGGRTALMKSFSNVFKAVLAVIKPIHDAFRDVFPPSTGKGLVSFSKGLEKLTEKLIISKKTSDKLGETFKQGFMLIAKAIKFVKSLLKGLEPIVKVLEKIGGLLLTKVSQGILAATAAIGKYVNKAVDWIKSNKTIMDAVEKIETFIKEKCDSIKKSLDGFGTSSNFAKAIKNLFKTFKETQLPVILNKVKKVLEDFIKYVENLVSTIKNEGIPAAIDKVTSSFAKLFNVLNNEYVPKAIDKLLETFEKIKDKVTSIDYKKAASNLSEGLVLEAYAASNSGEEVGETTVTMSDRIQSFEKTVAHVFTKVKWWFKQFKEIAVDVFTEVGKFFKGDANAFNIDRVLDLTKTSVVIALLWQLRKSLKSTSGAVSAFAGVLGNISGVLKATALEIKAKALVSLSIAIAVLAGSLFLLSLIPQNKLIMAGIALGVVGLALVGFAKLMNQIDMKAFGVTVIALSLALAALAVSVFGLAISMGILIASLYLLVKVFEKYAAMKPEVFEKGFSRIKSVITQLVKFLFGVGLSRGKGKGAAISLAALVISLYVLQNTLKFYAKMDPKIYSKGLERITGVIKAIKGLLLGLVLTTVLSSGPKLLGLSALLLSLVKSLHKMVGVLKEYSSMKTADIKKGLLSITAVLAAVGVFINAFVLLTYDPFGSSSVLKNMIGLTLVLGAMVGIVKGIADSIKLLSGVKAEPMKRAVIALETVLTTIGLFVISVSLFSNSRVIKSLAELAGLIIALAAAVYFLGKVPAKQAARGIIILGAALGVLAGALRLAGTGRMDIGVKEFLTLAIAATVLAFGLNELAKQPWKAILAAAGALSGVILALSESTKVIDTETTIKGLAKFLIVAGAAVGLAYVLSQLATLPWDGMLAAGASLSAVILSVGGAITLMGKYSGNTTDLVKFGVMALVVATIAISLEGLASVPMKQLMSATADMVLVLGSLTAAIYVLAKIDWKTSFKALANAAIFLGGFELMMLAIGKLNEIAKPLINESRQMALLLVAMSATMLIMSQIKVDAAAEALANIAIFVGGFALILGALGALSSKFKSISGFIDEGGKILGLLGKAIGEFIGGIAAGFSVAVASALPLLGNSLGAFANGAAPFLKAVKNIDASSLKGAAILAGTILIVSAASFINGILSLATLFTGGASPSTFAGEMKVLGVAVKSYADQVKGIDGKSVKASAEAVRALASVKIQNEGGLLSKLVGDNDLGTFAKNLVPLGSAIKKFSDGVKGINNSAIVSSANTVASLAKIKVTGDGTELANFAKKLVNVGTGFTDFSKSISGIDNGSIIAAAKSISTLASIKVANSDGFNAFSSSIQTLGGGIKGFSDSIADIDNVSIEMAAKAIAELAAIKVVDEKNLSKFSEFMEKLGTGLSSFGNAVSDVDNISISDAAKSVQTLASIKVATKDGMEKFAENLGSLGIGLKDFAYNVVDLDVDAVTKAAKAISSLAEIKFSAGKGIAMFSSNLNSLGIGIKNFSTDVEGIDNDAIISTSKSIAALASIKMSSSDSSIGFITNLSVLGTGIKAFYDSAKNIKTKVIYDVSKSIASLASIKIQDMSQLETFADNLKTLGTGIKSFSENASGTDIKSVSNAAKAVAVLAAIKIQDMSQLNDFSSGLSGLGTNIKGFYDNSKGVESKSVLDIAKAVSSLAAIKIQDMSQLGTFAGGLSKLGIGMKDFSDNAKGVNSDAISGVIKSVKSLAAMKIQDMSQLKTFATDLPTLGSGIQGFSDAVTKIDAKAIQSSVKSISLIAAIKISNGNTMGVFASNIESLGAAMAKFSASMANIGSNDIQDAISKIKALNNIGTKLEATTISSFSKSLQSIGEKGVNAFADTISNGIKKSTKAANKLESGAVNGLKSVKDNFSKAGSNATQGFLNGIKEKIQNGDVYAAGKSIGDTAYKAARKALDERSPSKKLKQVGIYAVQGLINGLRHAGTVNQLMTTTDSLMNEFAGHVIKVADLSDAISGISDVVNSDINSEPVIKPVMDLSDVESGASALNNMLNGSNLLGVTSANEISASINGSQVTATNDDVVSAINGLRRIISSTNGNTYNVNGVTYDDGSNITDAVKTLINATVVEKRL